MSASHSLEQRQFSPLYKYLSDIKYAEDMLSRGLIRVGTLGGYRGLEKFDDARNDDKGGVLHTALRIDEDCGMDELPLWKQMALRQMGHYVANSPGRVLS